MTVLEKKLAKVMTELIDVIVGLRPDAEKPLKRAKAVLGEMSA